MTAATTNLFLRPDTLFGVCEGLGQETGLPATLFRIAFALPLIFAPVPVLALYLALGVTLAALRWIAPAPAATVVETPLPKAEAAENDDAPLALAA